MTERVALDLDSTLAASQNVAFDLLEGPDHDMSYDDIESWNWGPEKYGTETFLSSIWHCWTIRGDEIEPMEPRLSSSVTTLMSRDYEVDVVTQHPDHVGITKAKRRWLRDQNIPYGELVVVPMGESKIEMDYDIYIDDKPGMMPEMESEDSELFLIDHSYNEDIDVKLKENISRVPTVQRAIFEMGIQ